MKTTSKEVIAAIHKKIGKTFVSKGVKLEKVERIPTGIFQFDLATGGGFPRGRISEIFGTESSGKTTLAYLAMGNMQKMGPKVVFIDMEHTFDAEWARFCGVDIDEVILISPQSAEQAIDMAQAFLYASDVGLMVLDSIPAMAPQNEIDSEASKQSVGGSSMLVGKFIRKANVAMEENKGIALILINQIRYKIGVMYGNPETLPGGQAIRYAISLQIRLNAKDKFDKTISDKLPTFRETTASIKKWKVPIVAKSFEYDLCVLPHAQWKVGDSPSWTTVAGFLKDGNLLVKGKKGWTLHGEEFDTLDPIRTRYENDHGYRLKLQADAIKVASKTVLYSTEGKEYVVDSETGEVLNK